MFSQETSLFISLSSITNEIVLVSYLLIRATESDFAIPDFSVNFCLVNTVVGFFNPRIIPSNRLQKGLEAFGLGLY